MSTTIHTQEFANLMNEFHSRNSVSAYEAHYFKIVSYIDNLADKQSSDKEEMEILKNENVKLKRMLEGFVRDGNDI